MSEFDRVALLCSRCGETMTGLETEVGTSGFYRLEGTIWAKYGRPGETVLCDDCMQADEGYRRDYAHVMPWDGGDQ